MRPFIKFVSLTRKRPSCTKLVHHGFEGFGLFDSEVRGWVFDYHSQVMNDAKHADLESCFMSIYFFLDMVMTAVEAFKATSSHFARQSAHRTRGSVSCQSFGLAS